MEWNSLYVYIQTLQTSNGCDSVVTLTLTINNSTTGTDIQTACDSYVWIVTYTIINTGHTLQTTNGCDVVTLNLTINNSTCTAIVIIGMEQFIRQVDRTYRRYRRPMAVKL